MDNSNLLRREDRLRRELGDLEQQIESSIANALRVPGGGLGHAEFQDRLQIRANEIRAELGLATQPVGNPLGKPRRWHRWLLWLSLGAALVAMVAVLVSR